MTQPSAAVETVYKENSAKILAVLVRIFGTQHFDLAEDVLQEAFRRALVAFEEKGIPKNPAAWIMTTAKNHAIDVIRAQRTQKDFAEDLRKHLESEWTLSYAVEQEFTETNVQDDLLRMIFMCAGADITPQNRIPLMLRTLCGFSIPAVSRALLLSEATVKKRLLRTRERLRGHTFEFPAPEQIPHAMDSVHTVIYLLFNEGYHSSDAETPMNLALCAEAISLMSVLVSEPRLVDRDTLGLLALMNYHLARVDARLDEDGDNVPIDLQDRSRWSPERIQFGDTLLQFAKTVAAGASGRFDVEAQIAAKHCAAKSFDETDWEGILALYDELVDITESPIAGLNRAVAMGYAGDPRGAIAQVKSLREHPLLANSHQPLALLAHLHAMLGDEDAARHHAEASARLGGTPQEQRVMYRQVERLLARRN